MSNRHSWEMLPVESNNLCSHQRESSGEAFCQSLSTILLLFVQVPQNFRANYSESKGVRVLPDSGHRTLTKHVLEGSKPLWGNVLLYLCIPMLFAVLGLQIPPASSSEEIKPRGTARRHGAHAKAPQSSSAAQQIFSQH